MRPGTDILVVQSTHSVGFLFGIIATPIFLFICLFLLYKFGFVNNARTRDGSQTRFPVVPFFFRLSAVGFAIFTFISVLVFENRGVDYLSYVSTWNLFLAVEYFVMGAIISHKQYVVDRYMNEFEAPMDNCERRLKTAHQIFGEIVIPCSWAVISVMWAIEDFAPPARTAFGWYVDIVCHIFTACAVTVDFVFAEYLVNPVHVSALLAVILVYLLCQQIIGVISGDVAYEFLLTDSPDYIGIYFGILGCQIGFFGLLWVLGWIKSKGVCLNRSLVELEYIQKLNQPKVEPANTPESIV